MRKYILSVFVFLTTIFTNSIAQEIYSDDFENYDLGIYISRECEIWRTWNNTLDGSEDPVISDTYSRSADKSLKISWNNDGIIKLDEYTSGNYLIEFYIYIPTDRQAYYNILQNFSGSDSKWGVQAYFRDSKFEIDGAGASSYSNNYESDSWIRMRHFINIGNDWFGMFMNDELIHSYKWSKGANGGDSGINELDAINFFAWSTSGIPEYYIDDVLIKQIDSQSAPSNLSYTIQNSNNIILNWDAAENASGYIVLRNDNPIAFTNENFFIDSNLYPGQKNYKVLAFSDDMGISLPTNDVDLTIKGGIERKFYLFEIFTGTWCSFCTRAATAVDIMNEEGYEIAVIEYHGRDPYETPSTSVRTDFYKQSFGLGYINYPATIFNGSKIMIGAVSSADEQKAIYVNSYNSIKPELSLHELNTDIELISTDPYTYNLNIEVKELLTYFTGEIRLHVALTETDIPEQWQTMSEVNFVLRNMYPDANGQIIDFSSGDTIRMTIPISVNKSYNIEKCEIISFLQLTEGPEKQILQVSKNKLYTENSTTLSKNSSIMFFPNPVTDKLRVSSPVIINRIEIINISGQIVSKIEPNKSEIEIDFTNYEKGIYIIKVYDNDNNIVTNKISVI